ncbi:MAG: MarR family transcriptional regulator [Rhodobacteraceae bacterium]|nr:MarR family transcriptional regulator [Paracoccaceae bacterium]
MTFEKTKSAGFLANHMARLFASELLAVLKPLGIAPAQFMTLLELWEENALTQKQLVERLDVEQATMANTLRRMERDGLVMRRSHPKDRRAQIICLTVKAMQIEQAAKQAAGRVNDKALAGIEDVPAFLELVSQVIANFQNDADR